MFAFIFTLHTNLSTTHLIIFTATGVKDNRKVQWKESFPRSDMQRVKCFLFCMFCVCVTPCDYKCRGTCWQPSNFLVLAILTVIFLWPVHYPEFSDDHQHWPEPFSLSLQPSLILKGETHSELLKGRSGYSEQMYWWQRKGHYRF